MGNITMQGIATYLLSDAEVERAVEESKKKAETYRKAQREAKESRELRERAEGPKPGHEPAPVLSWLYLGDRFTVRDEHALSNSHIAYVLQVSDVETPDSVYEHLKGAHIKHYLRLPGNDTETDNLIMEFGKAKSFIDLGLKAWNDGDEGHRVLVYCDEGVSRSVTVVLMYLLTQGWPLKGAVEYVKTLRPKSSPNKGYFAQLLEKERQLFGTNTLTNDDYAKYFVE
eukprot:m.186920 g.186920  ORF g.186920 m.186920 type:complete len:227 (-) comp13622_c2_seq2:5089-5769(-)